MRNLTKKELLKLSDETILRGQSDSGVIYLSEMLRIYATEFGKPCGGCPSKFPEYLQKLRNTMKKTETEVKKGDFQVKKGVMIPIFGTSEAYTADNLTDDIAVRILAGNANAKILFASLPDDWAERVQALEAEQKVNPNQTEAFDYENMDKELLNDFNFLKARYTALKGEKPNGKIKIETLAERVQELEAELFKAE